MSRSMRTIAARLDELHRALEEENSDGVPHEDDDFEDDSLVVRVKEALGRNR